MTDADSNLCDTRPSLIGRRILVVDGDESVVASVRQLLTPFQCSVDSAGDDAVAFAMIDDAISNERYDVVIADLHLSFKYGSALLPLLESPDHVPLILTCGFGFDPGPMFAKARHARRSIFLLKPFRADQFINAIKQVIDDSL